MSTLIGKRLGVISKLTKAKPGLGKTAMMKYIYLLQEVYELPLKYSFEIYTYGPYSSEVMEDIDVAKHFGAISMDICHYSNAYGYSLKPSVKVENYIKKEKSFLDAHKQSIQSIILLFGEKTAKELELITTIIYLYKSYVNNNWDASAAEISEDVHKIKPHFKIDEVKKEYKCLQRQKIFSIVS